MAHNVESTLQTTGAVGEQIGVVSDAHGGDGEGSKVIAEAGGFQADETGIYIDFKMATCPHRISLNIS